MAYENVKNLVAEYNDAKVTFQTKMKTAFSDIFSEFFTNYPEIKAVVWNQYTPYFNDGETCEFSVNEFLVIDSDYDVDLDDINSAYEVEDEYPSVYYGKPSDFTYEYRNQYPTCDEEIKRYEEKITNNPRYTVVCEAWSELEGLLKDIPEEIYLDAFGDHAFVVATKEGIDVRRFDHD